jgi:phosphate transport system protein
MRKSFQEELKEIEKEMIDMGQMVSEAVIRSTQSLKDLNVDEAKKIIAGDLLIDQKRWDIEEKGLQLIARQQPVATDLRSIIAILSITTDLERMGDYCEGTAKIAILHGEEPLLKPLIDIPRMADKARDMLKRSLEAFVDRDEKRARAICDEDDEVDQLYDQIYRELISFMVEDPKTITRATYLIWAAHNLERIADRVTNICERTVFLVTGKMEEINVSKY